MCSVLLLYRGAVFADPSDVAGSATAVAPGAIAASACDDVVGAVNGDDAVGTVDDAELPTGVGNFGAVGDGRAIGKRQPWRQTWRGVLRCE